MEKIDFRTISESAIFLIRKRAILLLQYGKKQFEVAKIIGVKEENKYKITVFHLPAYSFEKNPDEY